MIRAATPVDAPLLANLWAEAPCIGVQMQAEWELHASNPQAPVQCFVQNAASVLMLADTQAFLCGKVEAPAEWLDFLAMLGIKSVLSTGWVPAGWQTQALCCMQNYGKGALPPPAGFVQAPSPTALLALLQSGPNGLQNPTVADAFYSSYCAKRNHGLALAVGVMQQNQLVSTAGAYAITGREVYLAQVYTRPQVRGQGYAAALLRWLAGHFAPRPVTLLCSPAMQNYYKELAFLPLPQTVVQATAPNSGN